MNSNYLIENDSQNFFFEDFLNETSENRNFFDEIYDRPKFADFEKIYNSLSDDFDNEPMNYQINHQMPMHQNIEQPFRFTRDRQRAPPINFKR